MTATATRPRLSDEFLKANTRRRVLAGTAKAISELGYCTATVTDIVKACRTARNTFYDCFGSKEEAALALVAEMGCEFEELGETASLDVLLIEIAATSHAEGDGPAARKMALGAEHLLRVLAECKLTALPPADDPRQQPLPPGRQTLPAEFRTENQRTRLLSGLLTAVADRGYPATTARDACTQANVSTRTLYEHFGSLDELARATLSAAASVTALDTLDPQSGLGAVAIEVVAERMVDGHSPLAAKALSAVQKMTEAVSA